jgi:YycE-like protein
MGLASNLAARRRGRGFVRCRRTDQACNGERPIGLHLYASQPHLETRAHAADRAHAEIAILSAGTPTFPRKRFVHAFTSRFRGNQRCHAAWVMQPARLAGGSACGEARGLPAEAPAAARGPEQPRAGVKGCRHGHRAPAGALAGAPARRRAAGRAAERGTRRRPPSAGTPSGCLSWRPFHDSYGPDGTIPGLPGGQVHREIVRAGQAPYPGGGLDQLVFCLPDAAAREQMEARLAAAGTRPVPQIGCWQATGGVTCQDPDGREVVLASWIYIPPGP